MCPTVRRSPPPPDEVRVDNVEAPALTGEEDPLEMKQGGKREGPRTPTPQTPNPDRDLPSPDIPQAPRDAEDEAEGRGGLDGAEMGWSSGLRAKTTLRRPSSHP